MVQGWHSSNNCCATELVYPVRVSDNGRYFVDQNGQPVFWLGTTQWTIWHRYTLEQAEIILDRTREKGFTYIQAMLAGVGDGTEPNIYGEKPWLDNDPLRPNPVYFEIVDTVIEKARQMNLIFLVLLYHQRWRAIITEKNARAYACWLAERYRHVPNLVWLLTPEAKPDYIPVLRELALGLREGDGGAHLITVEPDPAPYSSSFIHTEPWLDFNCIQTWKSVELIYPMITHDYNLKPTKPVVLAEGAYEGGTEYGFEVSPLWVRRQAYYSYLAGAHHTYGHDHSWRDLPTWREALDAPGAVQMGILKRVLSGLHEWWRLVPDQSILVAGGNTEGKILNLAARHEQGAWLLVYLAEPTTVSVDLTKMIDASHAIMFWIDPRTGERQEIGEVPTRTVQTLTAPPEWEDVLLVAEAK
ncbi:MAG: glycoside hydrolase family 140 protein [Armatimonadetes bacterium]|nr:glycoside hydrolase family 140 protein [Armatimonadota bacterium]